MNTQMDQKESNVKNIRTPKSHQKTEPGMDLLNFQQLGELYAKTQAILNNPTIKLPDGGAKLKAKLEQIKKALEADESTAELTHKVSEMSLNSRPNSRKGALNHANNSTEAHKLLRPHSDIDTNARTARIISLEESIQLQDLQQKDIKEANMKKRMESVTKSMKLDSLADELSNTMGRLRLNPETRLSRPDDDGSSDGEENDMDSVDEDSDEDDDDLLYADEDEGFDEEEDIAGNQRR